MRKLLFWVLLLAPFTVCGQNFYGISYNEGDTVGIYYVNNDSVLTKIAPIRNSKTKSNTLASAFTYGIASASMKSIFRNPSSKNVLTRDSKVYFYFGNLPINQISTMYMFSPQYSVYDFAICEFVVNKKSRILNVGKINMWSGTEFGTNETEKVKFNVQEIRKGVFECAISELHGSGEFCFLFSHGTFGAYASVFDFSIIE